MTGNTLISNSVEEILKKIKDLNSLNDELASVYQMIIVERRVINSESNNKRNV